MADAVIVLSGELDDVVVDTGGRLEKDHYHPNVTATISVQGFVPVSAIPNTLILRVRQASPSISASVTCRVFDSAGNPVLVSIPTISIDGIVGFQNYLFAISGSSYTTFPALSIFTIEFDFSGVDVCGILICYKPSFPMVCEGNVTSPNCLTTTVIS